MQPVTYPVDVMARFWMKVRKDPSGCWVWIAGQNGNGYGQFDHRAGEKGAAHRLSYTMFVGPIPEGLDLDHLCRNRACVNPRHLEPVTPTENKLRGVGACAQKARATHCPHGHEYTPENTIRTKQGWRLCRECKRLQRIRYKAEKAKRAA